MKTSTCCALLVVFIGSTLCISDTVEGRSPKEIETSFVSTANNKRSISLKISPDGKGNGRGFYQARVPTGYKAEYKIVGTARIVAPEHGDWFIWVRLDGKLIRQYGYIEANQVVNFGTIKLGRWYGDFAIEAAWSQNESTTLTVQIDYEWR